MSTTRTARIPAVLGLVAACLSAPAAHAQTPNVADGSEVEALAAHYARVERELRSAPVDHLDAETRAARERAIQHLAEYRTARRFGVNTDFPDVRMPYFVDHEERRCAVAHLLDRSGCGDLTSRVARTANHAFVVELVTDPELRAWLTRTGLTAEEAARIQAPGRGNDLRMPRAGTPDSLLTPNWNPVRTPWSTWSGTLPGSGDGDVAVGGSAHSPGRPTVTPRNGAAQPPPDGLAMSDLAAETWQEWWSWNRAAYLEEAFVSRPVRILAEADDRLDWMAMPTTEERGRTRTALRRALKDSNAEVRAAACVALGRIAEDEDVASLIACVDDAAFDVRHEAILALGATGKAAAVHALLRIAATGSPAITSRTTRPPAVSILARSVAVVALGIAKRNGATSVGDDLVLSLCTTDHGPTENERLRTAALLYAQMTGSNAFADLELATAADRGAERGVRARAFDGLSFATADARRALLEALAGRDVTLRRSAAFALGASREPLALPSLMTAFELEHELFTRATLLIAIGRHGGPRARDFLVEQLRDGKRPLRGYAALALGLWNREHGEPDLHAEVRDAWKRDGNRDQSGAYLLAMGLGRDAKAVDVLFDVLATDANSWTRASAAEAMALLEGDAAKSALRAAIDTDACPYVRAVAAEILAWLGDPSDATRIVTMLREARTPEERTRLAGALGRVGGPTARRELFGMLDATTTDPRTRAAALTAIGIASSPDGARRLAPLGRDANFTVFPGWVRTLLASNL